MNVERRLRFEVEILAPLQEVWEAWTTQPGVVSFFAPAGKVELWPGGAYEMYFDLNAPQGDQGGEGLVVLAVQPPHMLSFTWNAPPSLPEVRSQHTHVTIRLDALSPNSTRLYFCEDGFGHGGQWDDRFEYFRRAWGEVVLPRLVYRFERGPVDWVHRPDLSEFKNRVQVLS